MQFADGTLARSPLAVCEVQGYAYAARVRCAELAREVWGDPELATRLEREARALRDRFDEAFWVERGDAAFYALALDRDKRPVDALSSNAGHLLWTGIAKQERIDAMSELLRSRRMFSGFGIRTLAAGNLGYNPIGYHTGTVWPHDSSLIAYGLALGGHRDDAVRIMRGLVLAGEHFGWRLPEVIAGYDRQRTGFPVEYPVACSPQAWAAGAPLLVPARRDRHGARSGGTDDRDRSGARRRRDLVVLPLERRARVRQALRCQRHAGGVNRRRARRRVGPMLLADLAATSDSVAATSSRLGKRDLIAACLARLEPSEAPIGLAFLAGEPRQRRTGIGYRGLGDPPPPASEPTLTLVEVDARLAQLEALSGPGSSGERKRLAGELFGRATAGEQRFLRALLTGELRQGALGGVLIDAVAKAAEVPPAAVRRALLLAGDLPTVGAAALAGGTPALEAFRIEVGRPLAPMLAGQRTGCRDRDRAPRDGGRGVEARRSARAGARARRRRLDLHAGASTT